MGRREAAGYRVCPRLQAARSMVPQPIVKSSDEDLPTEPEPLPDKARLRPRSPELGFIVLYCAEAPKRVGAFVPVPRSATATTYILGRGGARSSDEAPRLSAVFQRPGDSFRLPP